MHITGVGRTEIRNNIIEDNIEKLLEVDGIGPIRIDRIAKAWKDPAYRDDLIQDLCVSRVDRREIGLFVGRLEETVSDGLPLSRR